MILIYLVLLYSFGSARALNDFESFTKIYSKVYGSPNELKERKSIFLHNFQALQEHNARYEKGEVSWKKKINKYMDYTREEFIEARLQGKSQLVKDQHREHHFVRKNTKTNITHLPDYFSWVDQGAVTPIKDQGQCGSCAAFATIAAIETCLWQKSGSSSSPKWLSEQFILDCAYGETFVDPNPDENPHDGQIMDCNGCEGAWPQCYYNWISNQEIGFQAQSSLSYPYLEHNGECHPSDEGYFKKAMVTGMLNSFHRTEEEMLELVMLNPVTTNVDASGMGDYGGGVYEDERCCKPGIDCVSETNHSVTVVGWGTDRETGKDYWLVKNSWGEDFGEDGYIRIRRGTWECSIGTSIVMPYCEKL